MIPLDRLAKDIGKHFGQTSIELTRKTSARRRKSSVQEDISRILIIRHWQKDTVENQLR